MVLVGGVGGAPVYAKCMDTVASVKKNTCPAQLRRRHLMSSLDNYSALADAARSSKKPKWNDCRMSVCGC